jgi:general secretion pathway protein I
MCEDGNRNPVAGNRRAEPWRFSGYRLPATGYRAGGFTLIELVAAFVIFALGFGVLLQILGGALHTTSQSAEYTKAAMWAQSLLDTQGIGEPLQEGSSSGRFDDHYSWQLNVAKYDPPPVASTAGSLTTSDANGLITTPITQLDLFQLELVVSWGTQYLTHHARFSTVRVMNPPLQAGNTIPPLPSRRHQ